MRQLVQRRGVVALAAAELIHRRQLDAVFCGLVEGPIPAMDDDSPAGGPTTGSTQRRLQPHRQPLTRCQNHLRALARHTLCRIHRHLGASAHPPGARPVLDHRLCYRAPHIGALRHHLLRLALPAHGRKCLLPGFVPRIPGLVMERAGKRGAVRGLSEK